VYHTGEWLGIVGEGRGGVGGVVLPWGCKFSVGAREPGGATSNHDCGPGEWRNLASVLRETRREMMILNENEYQVIFQLVKQSQRCRQSLYRTLITTSCLQFSGVEVYESVQRPG
jgi:hypothetical protein